MYIDVFLWGDICTCTYTGISYSVVFLSLQELLVGEYNGTFAHYGLNMVNQKITFPRDDNFSDDELAFLPYFLYFYSQTKVGCVVAGERGGL